MKILESHKEGFSFMSKEIVVTDSNFEEEVLKSSLPVLVDFWAEWCGPCKMMGPIIEEIASEYEGRMKVAKLNVDENQLIASRYGIQSIPTLILFKGKIILKEIVGLQSKEYLRGILDKFIKKEDK